MTAPILITGAGQRIGLAFAQHCLDHQQPIIVTYRRRKTAIDELERNGAVCLHADFATNDGVADFLDRLTATTGSLRAIIHNASDWLPESREMTPEHVIQTMLQVHTTAPYLINLRCRSLLEAGEGPRDIIHMTDYVVDKGSAKHIAYAASKAGMANLTLSFARLLAPRVKVNSVAPSLILFNDHDDGDYRAKTLKKSLLEVEPGTGVAVETLQFLLDNSYLTGHTIALDGGRHLK
ncbi:dihydromonapterin reductase [Marinobacter caseinilyticus]|uniref:dihydromonapterin reductase n=1 Tax=Marinobacter caseinilyticus TaxID=2692195 RepID=UPI00140B9A73|nr:dihydromonapterin reductase [Marinobacter caseinilyticus]